MAVLICKFASSASKPEKIQRWIAYLDQVKQTPRAAADDQALVRQLRAEAERWLQPR